MVPNEKQATPVRFLTRAMAWFGRQGIEYARVLSDNGSAYRSHPWRQACEVLGLSTKRTRPYTRRTYSKGERVIKTIVDEWTYGLSFQSSRAACATWPSWAATRLRGSSFCVPLNDLLRKHN